MNIDQVYKIVLYSCAKNTQDGYISPDDFNLIINQAQRGYLDYLKGEYQRYQIKRPIAVVEFGQNQMIRQSLAPLVYSAILPISAGTGISSFPSDFEYTDAMWSIYGHYNIRFIQQDRQDSYIHSVIDPVVTNPVFLIRHEGFQFVPDRPYGDNQALMSYLRTPPVMTWAYSVDGNGIPVYDPLNSVDPIWADSDILQVIVRALSIVGVNLQLGVVSQYAQVIKEGGQ